MMPYPPSLAGNDKRLVQTMLALFSTLDYDFPRFSLPDFIRWLEAQRNGRPILLMARTLPPSLSGAWLAAEDRDYIFYDDGTLLLHQQHIQLHELSHLLCGHEALACAAESDKRPQALAAPGEMMPAFLRLGFPRAHPAEQEAEVLASLIHLQVLGQEVKAATLTDSASQVAVLQALRRLQAWLRTLSPLTPSTWLPPGDEPRWADLHIYQTVIHILDWRRRLCDSLQRVSPIPTLARLSPQTHALDRDTLPMTQPVARLQRLLDVNQDIGYAEFIRLCCEIGHHLPPGHSL
jgi:hypothetical protein